MHFKGHSCLLLPYQPASIGLWGALGNNIRSGPVASGHLLGLWGQNCFFPLHQWPKCRNKKVKEQTLLACTQARQQPSACALSVWIRHWWKGNAQLCGYRPETLCLYWVLALICPQSIRTLRSSRPEGPNDSFSNLPKGSDSYPFQRASCGVGIVQLGVIHGQMSYPRCYSAGKVCLKC